MQGLGMILALVMSRDPQWILRLHVDCARQGRNTASCQDHRTSLWVDLLCALMTACMDEFFEILLSLALVQRRRVSRVASSQA
jgi:hypothetical protein